MRASASKSVENSSACSLLGSKAFVYKHGKAARETRECSEKPLGADRLLGSLLLELLPSLLELLSALVRADAFLDMAFTLHQLWLPSSARDQYRRLSELDKPKV